MVLGRRILSDGEGTLTIAETCVLNPNRNPGWSKAQAEAELRAMLGMQKVIWLPGDVTDTETDGHVDGPAVIVGISFVTARIGAWTSGRRRQTRVRQPES